MGYLKHSDDRTVHVLMRFANNFLSTDDVIKEHQAVIARHKSVWIGKVGKPLGKEKIALVSWQIDEGIPSYLFLVQKVGTEYEVHRARIIEMARSLPAGQEKWMPKYYVKNNIAPRVALWTSVSGLKRFPTKGLSEWHITSSHKPVPSTLKSSMAALFLISKGKGSAYA